MAKDLHAALNDLHFHSLDRRTRPVFDASCSAWMFEFTSRSSDYRLAGETDPPGAPPFSMSEAMVAEALISGSLKY
jgi:hypothetical protein